MSEEGAEMMDEETLTNEVMGLFEEEHGILELARRMFREELFSILFSRTVKDNIIVILGQGNHTLCC